MPSCMVPGCSSTHKNKMRFFRFPKINRRSRRLTELSTRRQTLWLTALRRSDPLACLNLRVCQLHFITGRSARLSDIDNVDWVPTLNMPSDAQAETESHLEEDVAGGIQDTAIELDESDFHVGIDRSGFDGYHETDVTVEENNSYPLNVDDDTNTEYLYDDLDDTSTEYVYDDFDDYEKNGALFSETTDEFYAIDDIEEHFYGYVEENEHIETEKNELKTEHLEIELLEAKTEDIEFERKPETVETRVKDETWQPHLSDSCLRKIYETVATQTDTSITETPTDLFLTYEQKIHLLEQKLSSYSVRLENFENNNAKTCFFTGLTNYETMKGLFHSLEADLPRSSKLTKFQIFFMVLIRLRLNFSFRYMAYKFEVSPQTISRQFYKGLYVFYSRLRTLVYWPTREALHKTMPLAFQEHFGKLITTIIDCFEIYIQKSALMKAQAQTWSQYKHHNTVKYLIAIAPQGMISFISPGYGGRASDKFVTEDCGILNLLEEGDCVMADRGFLVEDAMKEIKVSLNIPAFTKGKTQLHPYELETTRWIANVRIHVERVIGLLRSKYTILNQRKFPISAISKVTNGCNVPVIDQIVTVCSALVNLCRPICVKENIEV